MERARAERELLGLLGERLDDVRVAVALVDGAVGAEAVDVLVALRSRVEESQLRTLARELRGRVDRTDLGVPHERTLGALKDDGERVVAVAQGGCEVSTRKQKPRRCLGGVRLAHLISVEERG